MLNLYSMKPNKINRLLPEKIRKRRQEKQENESSYYDGFAINAVAELAGETGRRVQDFEKKGPSVRERTKRLGRRALGMSVPKLDRYDRDAFGVSIAQSVNSAVENNDGKMPIELYDMARQATAFNQQGHIRGLRITDSQRTEAYYASKSVVEHPSFLKDHEEAVKTLTTPGMSTENFMHEIKYDEDGQNFHYTLREGYDKDTLADINAIVSDERMWQKASTKSHEDLARMGAVESLQRAFKDLSLMYPESAKELGDNIHESLR
jgi:hypothetical protein